MTEAAPVSGPDFSKGVKLADIPEGVTLAGRVGDEPILLSRLDGRLSAVGGTCTHYGGALADGLIDGDTVRCPLHHACFSLRTGEALSAPAFAPLDRWQVDIEGELVFVRVRVDAPAAEPAVAQSEGDPRAIVLVGGGAAAFACAEQLRRLGYGGRLTMIGAEADPPIDRPNLSKDYLAGTAPAEWIPLREPDWYRDAGIDLHLGAEVVAIDTARRTVATRDGATFPFDRLLVATGAEPIRPPVPGFDRADVLTLRALADAAAIVDRAQAGARAVVIGSGFIGLEAAAALRNRSVAVDIVSADIVPFERTFGSKVGAFFRDLHEREGVRFHLGISAAGFDGRILQLDDGSEIEADFVLLGTGVRPRTALAEAAGLSVENGILVDSYLETSIPGIFAAGDVASCPDPATGVRVRIEHWVHAERQGQAAAASMLGHRRRFDSVPFFWSEQYGVAIRHVGHAAHPDEVLVEGDVGCGAFTARYYENGLLRASASVGRDRAALEDELFLERLPELAAESDCPGVRETVR